MVDFLRQLREATHAQPNLSGLGARPPFNPTTGSWTNATKSNHALLLVEEALDGTLDCSIPTRPDDRFRLGQINFSSLRPQGVVAFKLWCATRRIDEVEWELLEDHLWYLVFRLDSRDVADIRARFEGNSQSGIEFRFNPIDGRLAAYTQKQVVPCRYVRAAILACPPDEDVAGFDGHPYEEITNSFRSFLRLQIAE